MPVHFDPSQLSPDTVPVVRDALPADHVAIREVVLAAYLQFADALPPQVFPRYLADLVDLDRHTEYGELIVAELDRRIVGSAAFYPDTSVQGFGWPAGWAGGRGLAVHPAARNRGVAQALLAECERRSAASGAPVFAFHTAAFMASAVALYERMGYRRATEFDLDLNAHFGFAGPNPVPAIAYRRDLVRLAA